MERLLEEVLGAFGLLRRWGDAVQHGDDRMQAATRGVLDLVLSCGPETVSGMARARGVSRQQVQQQVDRLLELGFVERLPNPAHKRAPLIELTDKGRALIESIRSSERDALSRLQPGVSDEAIADAVRVLQAVQAALERDLEARKAARL